MGEHIGIRIHSGLLPFPVSYRFRQLLPARRINRASAVLGNQDFLSGIVAVIHERLPVSNRIMACITHHSKEEAHKKPCNCQNLPVTLLLHTPCASAGLPLLSLFVSYSVLFWFWHVYLLHPA